ncbi:MAG: hypothetical protein AAGD14_14060 [Planctomycetota bacterium]
MQNELAGTDIRILGLNSFGLDSGNAETCAGRDIPWLQEDGLVDAAGRWEAAYRDVVILDAENKVVAVYNLTANNLADAAKYDELKALMTGALGTP